MVVTGAAAAAIGGQVAGGTVCQGPGMCYRTGGSPAAGAAVAAAGIGAALAGGALIESQKGDQMPSRVKPDHPPLEWRLERAPAAEPAGSAEPVGSAPVMTTPK